MVRIRFAGSEHRSARELIASSAARALPWLGDREAAVPRLALMPVGFLPVTLIAISTFGAFGLRDLATHLLVPAVLTAGIVVSRFPQTRRLVLPAIAAGMVATGFYDVLRFAFLWLHLMNRDPIPHIGSALHLQPAWVFGYLWRYLGNGGGLALAFTASGFKGVRAGVLYGLLVCGGLVVTLIVAPYGQAMLFPLTWTTIVMATLGHVIYGAVLGGLTARRGSVAADPSANDVLSPEPSSPQPALVIRAQRAGDVASTNWAALDAA